MKTDLIPAMIPICPLCGNEMKDWPHSLLPPGRFHVKCVKCGALGDRSKMQKGYRPLGFECPICGREMERESVSAIPGMSAIKERHPGPGNELRSSLPSVPVVIEPYRVQVVFVCPGGHA